MEPHADNQQVALQALAEPGRRQLYELVAAAQDSVSRDEAAAATGMTRGAAAFHLDHLVDAGLLRAEYRRLGGRSGPGAGRPAKLYRAVAPEVAVSVPPRRYVLAAQVFAGAIARLGGGLDEAAGVAHRLGRTMRPSEESERGRSVLMDQLAALGYAPTAQPDAAIGLANCPFRQVVERNREVMCTTNRAFLQGITEAVGARFTARLAPQPGWCCVRLEPTSRGASAAR